MVKENKSMTEAYSPYNLVMISVHAPLFEEEVKSASGFIFYRNTSFRPEWHVLIWGEVVGVPGRVNTGVPGYHNIDPFLRKGDKVYFHYTALRQDNLFKAGDLEVYPVEYESIFCRVRPGGEIDMVGDWNLVEPLEITLPRPEVSGYRNQTEKEIMTGMVNKKAIATENTYRKSNGILRHKATLCPWQPGDWLRFRDINAFENTVEGKSYFCIKTPELVVKIKENAKTP